MAPIMQQTLKKGGNRLSFGISVDFSELIPAFSVVSGEEFRELAEGLVAYINKHIIGRTAKALKDNGNIVSGRLVNSLFVKLGKINYRTLEVSIIYGSKAPYAFAFNYGSRPHIPPFRKIYEWKRDKYNLPEKNKGWMTKIRSRKYDVSSMAYQHARAVWVHIRKHGTQPHRYFFDALKMTEQDAGVVILDMAKGFPRIAAKARRAAKKGRLFGDVNQVQQRVMPTQLQFNLTSDIRTVLYKTGQITGFLDAAGLGEYAFRKDIYKAASGIGDYSSVVGNRIGRRLEVRGLGKISGRAIHSMADRGVLTSGMDSFSLRITRYSGGKWVGEHMQGLKGF